MARQQAVLVVDSRAADGIPARWVDGGQLLREEEARLAALVACGLSNAEIARRCHVAPDTVHHRVARLCARLDVRNRVELAAWAGAHGLWPYATIDAPAPPARPDGRDTARRGAPHE